MNVFKNKPRSDITFEIRKKIEELINKKFSPNDIGKIVGISKTCIQREIDLAGYPFNAEIAHKRAQNRTFIWDINWDDPKVIDDLSNLPYQEFSYKYNINYECIRRWKDELLSGKYKKARGYRTHRKFNNGKQLNLKIVNEDRHENDEIMTLIENLEQNLKNLKNLIIRRNNNELNN